MTLQGLILLIQSESLIRSRIFELLENKNFNIISSEDGLLGLRLAKEFQPDLIICDLNTPHNEGFTFFKKLRFILENLKIPCIFLISEAELDRYYHAQQLGVDDYLTKPIQNEQLLEAISRQFKKIQNQEVDCV